MMIIESACSQCISDIMQEAVEISKDVCEKMIDNFEALFNVLDVVSMQKYNLPVVSIASFDDELGGFFVFALNEGSTVEIFISLDEVFPIIMQTTLQIVQE